MNIRFDVNINSSSRGRGADLRSARLHPAIEGFLIKFSYLSNLLKKLISIDANLAEGQRAYFEAKVNPAGDPNMRVDWFIDGKPLAASSCVTVTSRASTPSKISGIFFFFGIFLWFKNENSNLALEKGTWR